MQLTRVPPLAAAALAALLAGCDSPQSPSERAPSITIDAARDVEPGDTVLVRLKAMAGATSPYPGLEIRLSVTGGGAISTDQVVTDPSGSASLQWILAATEDSQSVRAVAPSGAILALEPRWRVHAVELEPPATAVVVDSAFVGVRVLNRAGAAIARAVTSWIVATPDFDSLTVASFSNGRLDALTPGFVTIHAVSEGVAATPLRLRIAPRVAVLASFDQAAPAVAGDTVVARGYRLDLGGELTLAGTRVATIPIDSTSLRVIVPPIDATPCRGWAYLPATLSSGIVHTRGVRLQRAGELTLAPGAVLSLGAARDGCVRLAPIPGAEYALMYVDTRPIASAEQGLFPNYLAERFNFDVGLDFWSDTLVPSSHAAAPVSAMASSTGAADVIRATPTPTAPPPDAIELRATPWHIGDRASVNVGGVYKGGTIVRVSQPFVALVLDEQQVPASGLAQFDEAMELVQRAAVPMLKAALSNRTPFTSAGSGQFVIVLSEEASAGNAGLFFGIAAAVHRSTINADIIVHELAHAWQDLFNRDQCGGIDRPFACWKGSRWAVEGGAAFLSQEAWRRAYAYPLVGATAPGHSWYGCCGDIMSPTFGDGYGSAVWFFRDQLVRTVENGASEDAALAAVARGSLEGWFAELPQFGLAHRLTNLLGRPWTPLNEYETSVWSLGMDESAAPDTYQFLAWRDYHFGRVGTIIGRPHVGVSAGTFGGYNNNTIAGTIAGDTFGHVLLLDRGSGGAYRFSVAADGFVWAIGRVR